MPTTDHLETVYSAVDRYTGKVNQMAQTTAAFGREVRGAISTVAAFAAAGAGSAMVKFAVDSAVQFDTARRKLQAFTGSAQEAERATNFIQELAGPSLFEFGDLAKAANLLAAYGLNIQKTLPLVEQLASAFGETGESVSEVARVFGRLKSGDFGEAFERLRDFGISFDDLRAKGLKFSKSNEFLGTRLQALAAVSEIVQERFGGIADLMRESPAAKFASLMDGLRRGAAEAGNVILKVLVPAAQEVSNVLSYLVQSGIIRKVTQSFLFMFTSNVGKGALTRGLLYIVAILKAMPMTLLRVRGVFETIFAGIAAFIKPVVALLAGLAAARMVAGIIALGSAVFKFAQAVRAVGIAAAIASSVKNPIATAASVIIGIGTAIGIGHAFDDMTKGLGKSFGDMAGGLSPDELGKDVSKMMGDMEKQRGGGFGSSLASMLEAAIGASFAANGNDTALNQTMKGIESNTRATAQNTRQALDLRKFALGGGDNGAMGITAIERYGGRGGGGRGGVNINLNSTAVRDKLAGGIQEIVVQTVEELMRGGLLRAR